MRDDLGLLEQVVVESKIDRGGVDGIGIENDKPVNFAGVEIGDELFEVAVLIAG